VLIDVGRRLLPPGFDSQPKRGFTLPFDAWLRGPLREPLADALSERSVRARGLFASAATTALWESFLAGSSGWARPWLLLVLETWCREVLDSPRA
jgi:asparagine synthase (glutamine-hydrolysing)